VALAEKLPLKTPFSVDYFLVNACNLRCVFCGFSSSDEEYKFPKRISLDFNLFKKSIDDMKNFSDKIKTIHFMGYGEPLLHERISDMVAYTVSSNVAEKVDIVTNGILLSHKLSDKLIAAKLDWLRISVNGLSSAEYKKNCGANVDFNKFIDNIAYFFNNRGNTKVYIKILDYMVETEERKKMFYDIFEPICDALSIEHLGDCVEGIDFQGISGNITGLTVRGTEKCTQKVCPLPFYMLRVNPDGNCTPCCEPRFKVSLGNISEIPLPDIWNGIKFNRFRYAMLDGANKMSGMCKVCQVYLYQSLLEDVLDNDAERLKQFYTP
jgi:MoaA/NifB/PqqE/SkfB family radical SAM enzyme